LTDAGNTVIVIEHNLDVIKTADWIVDLGPEGGEGGGRIVALGSPEEVATVPASYTGQFLRQALWGVPDNGQPGDCLSVTAGGQPEMVGSNGARR
ncbi:MAG TPA: hypothetical protein VLC52_00295, partial [Anaerolineae bacterium]|nr:hypothetical protein [Anaerolineae bacterium]